MKKFIITITTVGLLLFSAIGVSAKPTVNALEVSPNPVIALSDFIISGCGYTPNSTIRLILTAPGVTAFQAASIGSSGCIPNDYYMWATNPGTATLDAYQVDAKTKKPAGTVTFEIVP